MPCTQCGKPVPQAAQDDYCSAACAGKAHGVTLAAHHLSGPASWKTETAAPTKLQQARARRDKRARQALAANRRPEAAQLLKWGRELDQRYGAKR